MFNIADYLKRFSKLEGESALEKNSISSALKEVCGIDGATFDIKKGVITIQGSHTMRSVVFTKKSAILASIRQKNPLTKVRDIR